MEEDRPRTGTFWTASAHISSAMVGTILLYVAWDIAHLGWIAGPAAMCLISFLCYCTSCLLCDCYDSASPDRNCTYADSVRSILGMEFHYCVVASHYFGSRTLIKLPINFCIQMYSKKCRVTFNYVIIGTLDSQNISIFRVIFSGGVKAKACAFIQYLTIFGMAVEIMVAASWSMMAIKYTNCYHKRNGEKKCDTLSNPYAIIFGITEILLSQIPDFDGIWWVSIVSVVMLFTNAFIGLGLAIARVAAGGSHKSNEAVTGTKKIWRSFRALGDITFAYSFSEILIEIQDTISESESESKSKSTMKKATLWSTVVMTTLFMLWGCVGYAAFGDLTPEDLTNSAFDGPFWLIYIANAASLINLVGRYQIYSQPIFAVVEEQAAKRWRCTREREIPLPGLGQMNLFRLVWRTVFVILTTVISVAFPRFNDVVEIITLGFWPLAVYFPVEMYIKQKKIDRWSSTWVCLQMLSMACLAISIMATVGSIAGLKDYLKDYRPFRMKY
ncbi:hypothetical protein ACJRO7_033654 [Eucalyptus globulus]|uniref:Amino acid transporter transmembrane domain-containing protein n=1 Tax=Eucalyptus globulus TaxID=34317 RepID=A0ABD3JND2_EUCGL